MRLTVRFPLCSFQRVRNAANLFDFFSSEVGDLSEVSWLDDWVCGLTLYQKSSGGRLATLAVAFWVWTCRICLLAGERPSRPT